VANDEERRFRLRPRKPVARTERIALASAYKAVMHYARMTSRRRRSGGQGFGCTRPHFQRCAVRVAYTKNSTRGQWRAHGGYRARESATHEGDPRAVGFNATEESIDISARLEGWQKVPFYAAAVENFYSALDKNGMCMSRCVSRTVDHVGRSPRCSIGGQWFTRQA
jgi:hypothetical protein